MTVFSAPNYCGEFDNAGAMMSVDDTLMCSFQVGARPPRDVPKTAQRLGLPADSSPGRCAPPACAAPLADAACHVAADPQAGGEETEGLDGPPGDRARLAARQEGEGLRARESSPVRRCGFRGAQGRQRSAPDPPQAARATAGAAEALPVMEGLVEVRAATVNLVSV